MPGAGENLKTNLQETVWSPAAYARSPGFVALSLRERRTGPKKTEPATCVMGSDTSRMPIKQGGRLANRAPI